MKYTFIISFIFSALQCSAQNYEVKKTKFNTDYAEYCAGLLKDGVVYSSNRKPEVMKTHLDENDNYYTNLYIAKEENGESKNQQELLSKEISSVLNEGSLSFEPGGRTFWYTSNIVTENDKIRPGREFKLGIYKAAKRDGKWTRVGQLPFNSKDQQYNVAHPAMAPDGSFMVFSSDMKGSVGASDLWIVYKTEDNWSEPKPLPKGINTPANELFPYVDKKGTLYFSSNGLDEGSGLDVYSTNLFTPAEFEIPERMKAPINSEFDDYAFLLRDDGETGYFSSNRENLNDDVYSFEYTYPDFVGCQENYKPYMCYLIEETNLTYIDTLPLAYIWDFGDGTTANGFRNEHCYADTGFFEIKLDIIDTITGVIYATISDMELLIEQPNQPYITSPDTLIMNDDALFSSAESTFDGFVVQEWFWAMGSEKNLRGAEVNYSFDRPGRYQIKLMALSEPDESGFQSKSCVYKEVLVIENELELEILREIKAQEQLQLETSEEEIVEEEIVEEEIVEEKIVLNYNHLEDKVVQADHLEESFIEEPVESTYYVEVVETEEPINLSDPYFEKINHEITERYQKKDSTYVYSVGQANEVFALWDVYKEVRDSGYVSAIVKQDRIAKFEKETEQVGNYKPKSGTEEDVVKEETNEWNRTITDFANIQFDLNSSKILSESISSLDYIAAMMSIEQEFNLSIDAHTDDRGNESYNITLSDRRADAVRKYLIRKGVDPKRLKANGLGSEEPISSNETELGRAINRRVEFRIISNLLK